MTKLPESLAPHIGMVCQGHSVEEVLQWAEEARDRGFRVVQPVLFSSGYGEQEFRQLGASLKALDLSVCAFGVYADIVKGDRPVGDIFKGTLLDLIKVIPLLKLLGTTRVVSWCGTRCSFAQTCPANEEPLTAMRFSQNLSTLLPHLKTHQAQLLFEPWYAHLLKNETMTADNCAKYPDLLGCVLDYPNFIRPEEWPRRQNRVDEIDTALAQFAGIIHLKDMTCDTNSSVGLPMFGQGDLTSAIGNKIRPHLGRIPIIVEHFNSPDDLDLLIATLEDYFA